MKTTLVTAAFAAYAAAHATSYEADDMDMGGDLSATGVATVVATASASRPTASAPVCTYNFATATDCKLLDLKCQQSAGLPATCQQKASACSVCEDAYNKCRQPTNGVSANQASCASQMAGCVGKAYPESLCPGTSTTPSSPTTPASTPTHQPSHVTVPTARPTNGTVPPVAGAAANGISLLGLAAGLVAALL